VFFVRLLTTSRSSIFLCISRISCTLSSPPNSGGSVLDTAASRFRSAFGKSCDEHGAGIDLALCMPTARTPAANDR
jgi:hypothetical protein